MADDDELSHLDERGQARMVDVGDKGVSRRLARASALVRMQPATMALLLDGRVPKGDVFATARIAGIQAAKHTWELIPLCHPLQLGAVEIDFQAARADSTLRIEVSVRATDRTGAEMEALSAASIAALTVYDMLKAVDRGMRIESVQLEEKRGGKSGDWVRSAD
jgi:cyclic pyranopterin phosphate synthase